MRTLLIAAFATGALAVAPADAAGHHKKKYAKHLHPAHTAVAPAPVVRGPQVGPPWAGPNQCWTDDGYGRYAPCDGGGRSM